MNKQIVEENAAVARRLKEAREDARFSQLDLAEKAGISQGFLAMVESNKKVPTLTTIFKICKALEIRPAMLFEEKSPDRETSKKEIISLIQKNL